MSHVPYVGVVGFREGAEVEELRSFFCDLPLSQRGDWKFHVGAMMSYKTLHGHQTKWRGVFPHNEIVRELFVFKDLYNCLHYADYEADQHSHFVWKDISEALLYTGPNLHALQLDMVWPDPGAISRALETTPKKVEVILQVGRRALEEVNFGTVELNRKIARYYGVVDRFLLDKSGGEGVPMNPAELLSIIEGIKEWYPTIPLVVAGGLGPTTVHLADTVRRTYPDISLDAQSRLTVSGNAQDRLSMEKCKRFLDLALRPVPGATR